MRWPSRRVSARCSPMPTSSPPAPSTIARDDIDALRAEGLDDRAIHDACAIVAYFAFVNRIADGLGVELEAE